MQSSPQTPGGEGQGLTGAQAETPPLITAPTPVLVTTVVGFFVVMALMFILLARWRAGRRMPQAQRIRDPHNTEFFQPAGEGAEITFEDGTQAEYLAPPPADDGPAMDYVPAEPDEAPAKAAYQEPMPALDEQEGALEEPAAAPSIQKKRGFFGLFGKRKSKAPSAEAENESEADVVEIPGDDDHASVTIERGVPHDGIEPDDYVEQRQHDLDESEREQGDADERRWTTEAEQEDRRRQADEERFREDERQRAEMARLAADDARRRDDEARRRAESEAAAYAAKRIAASDESREADLARVLSEFEEALHVQREAIQSETRTLLDAFARRFSDRLDTIADAAARQAPMQAAALPGSAEGIAATDALARAIADHRRDMQRAISSLSARIDAAGGAPEETRALRAEIAALRDSLGARPAAAPAAPSVQLADIVRATLAPGAYEFGAMLKNNRRADCLVKLPHPPGPIAVDARFPVEAFNALRQSRNGGAEEAESEFRRVALRHIVDIAERLISPDETADSALMFLPSETMFAELHARFPDVVQDANRARVWIVSPTTLMATLHTMRAVMSGADQQKSAVYLRDEAERVLTEVGRLRERVSTLEESFERARDDMRFVASTTDEVYSRAETITRSGKTSADDAPKMRRGHLSRKELGEDGDDAPKPPAPLR